MKKQETQQEKLNSKIAHKKELILEYNQYIAHHPDSKDNPYMKMCPNKCSRKYYRGRRDYFITELEKLEAELTICQ